VNDREDGDALVPDEVTGPGDEPDDAAPAEPPARPDRLPLWAMIAGLSACWFTLFGPLLAFILAPVAILLGRRALRRVQGEGGTQTQRRQAKIGLIAGIVAGALILIQVILFQLLFEWEKDVPEVEPKGAETSETTPSETTPTTTEPLG
jgi:hypothetical protein